MAYKEPLENKTSTDPFDQVKGDQFQCDDMGVLAATMMTPSSHQRIRSEQIKMRRVLQGASNVLPEADKENFENLHASLSRADYWQNPQHVEGFDGDFRDWLRLASDVLGNSPDSQKQLEILRVAIKGEGFGKQFGFIAPDPQTGKDVDVPFSRSPQVLGQ